MSTTEKITRLDSRPTDAALVAAACRGDMRAKEALFHRYVGMASGLAYRLLGRDTDLDDVVQESFTVAFATLEKLAKPQAFAAWFRAIVTGTAIAVIRRRRFLARFGLSRQEPIDLDTLIAPTAPPEIAAELRAVYSAIDALPASERVVLLLRRVEHLPLEEIAEQTGLSLATVKRRLERATGALARAAGRGQEDRR
jgi:RNA polymerase sigma-70 factor, ECF subfamily